MKIKTIKKSYDEVVALPKPERKKPLRPWFLLRTVIRILAIIDMWQTKFTYSFPDKDKLPKGPCLILMNHSSFIDLKIVSKIFYPKPYSIVCTSDGFVGKSWLMRRLGCIPAQKFVTDMPLIRDMKYAIEKKKLSILMYPEASYSFDGCATPLPEKIGGLLKLLKVPVVMITTHGAFARDPLYNGLRLRKVKVSADVKYLLSPEDIESKSVPELDAVLSEAFTFDNFKWQYENNIKIAEPFRAIGLERILYKCSECGTEGQMLGKGTGISCLKCGKKHNLNVLGQLESEDGDTRFSHIPDWFGWERECVRDEIKSGSYKLDTDVSIGMMVNFKAIYMVGEGHLTHDENGFLLTGCDGKLYYEQKPLSSYSLYSDYFWYEIGDMICIGNRDVLYYCFPKTEGVVTKTRIAAEELFKIKSAQTRRFRSK